MIARDATIVNELGMHARPAATFVKTAARFGASIRVSKGDLEVNGKSIMGVLMLAAECGSTITISADGDDAEAAVDALTVLIQAGFKEVE